MIAMTQERVKELDDWADKIIRMSKLYTCSEVEEKAGLCIKELVREVMHLDTAHESRINQVAYLEGKIKRLQRDIVYLKSCIDDPELGEINRVCEKFVRESKNNEGAD